MAASTIVEGETGITTGRCRAVAAFTRVTTSRATHVDSSEPRSQHPVATGRHTETRKRR